MCVRARILQMDSKYLAHVDLDGVLESTAVLYGFVYCMVVLHTPYTGERERERERERETERERREIERARARETERDRDIETPICRSILTWKRGESEKTDSEREREPNRSFNSDVGLPSCSAALRRSSNFLQSAPPVSSVLAVGTSFPARAR